MGYSEFIKNIRKMTKKALTKKEREIESKLRKEENTPVIKRDYNLIQALRLQKNEIEMEQHNRDKKLTKKLK